jgi:hypothetical protein
VKRCCLNVDLLVSTSFPSISFVTSVPNELSSERRTSSRDSLIESTGSERTLVEESKFV